MQVPASRVGPQNKYSNMGGLRTAEINMMLFSYNCSFVSGRRGGSLPRIDLGRPLQREPLHWVAG
eukprot:13008165-Heterocapsa_arctica.AAC.1